jgi:hypothetical protein
LLLLLLESVALLSGICSIAGGEKLGVAEASCSLMSSCEIALLRFFL